LEWNRPRILLDKPNHWPVGRMQHKNKNKQKNKRPNQQNNTRLKKLSKQKDQLFLK
jgi:hypothetical protein